MDVNSCKLHNPEVVPGLIYVDSLPADELGWSDELEMAVCMDCYRKALK
jgi:hypothetical protein